MTVAELLALEKTVERHRRSAKPGHAEVDIVAMAEGGRRFDIYVRQNTRFIENFSVGIRDSETNCTLLRVNGDHGHHRNKRDGRLMTSSHVHHWFELAEREPKPGKQPPDADPIELPALLVEHAWREFCSLVSLSGTDKLDVVMIQLHQDVGQLSLDGLDVSN